MSFSMIIFPSLTKNLGPNRRELLHSATNSAPAYLKLCTDTLHSLLSPTVVCLGFCPRQISLLVPIIYLVLPILLNDLHVAILLFLFHITYLFLSTETFLIAAKHASIFQIYLKLFSVLIFSVIYHISTTFISKPSKESPGLNVPDFSIILY